MGELRPHPVAECWVMAPADYEALKADIAGNGVLEPIEWATDDQERRWILDGVHRWRAGRELSVDVPEREIAWPDDVAAFCASRNVARRHLTENLRGVIADNLSALSKQGPKSAKLHFSPPTTEAASELLSVSMRTTKSVRKVRLKAEKPKAAGWIKRLYEKVRRDEVKASRAEKEIDRWEKAEAAKKRAKAAPKSDRWQVLVSDVADLAGKVKADSVDVVICDPPYDQESIGLFGEVAEFSAKVLRPGGSLLIMSGSTYLPEVYQQLQQVEGVSYQWELAYETSGRSTAAYHRSVSSMWKPVIWMVKGKYEGPYIRSLVRFQQSGEDTNEFHKWGQIVAGGEALLYQFLGADGAYAGGTVCDPMCGGGGFGVAALLLGAGRFIGADVDSEAVNITKGRLADVKV